MSRERRDEEASRGPPRRGGIFGFGLSEKEHGADIYAHGDGARAAPGGGFVANGRKYYIGNGNEAALLSVLGKMPDGKECVFFAADPKHPTATSSSATCATASRTSPNSRSTTCPSPGRRDPRARPRGVGRVAQHGERREVQPRLGVDRHRDARPLRGRPARDPAAALQDERDRLPAREADVHGRVGEARRDAPLRAARVRLLPLGLARRPALPSLQPGREDEGDDAGRVGRRPPLGRHRGEGVREGDGVRDGGARHPRRCRSSRAPCTSTSR